MARGEPAFVELGELDMDLVCRRLRVGPREWRLTGLEARLLAYLADRLDTDVCRDELLSQVWGYAPSANSRAVDFVVSRLRAKLGDTGPLHLLTSHGVGYRLSVQAVREVADPGPDTVPVRLPSGSLDVANGRFVPDEGVPVVLGREEVAVLLRLVGGGH